jgi:hypothetical protein
MPYRLAAFLLLVVLPVMSVRGAPVPEPFAILDIGPPTHGQTAEEHLKHEMLVITEIYDGHLCEVWRTTEVGKLEPVAALADPRPWLSKNLEVSPISGMRRLRLNFRAGKREEQVLILNCLLRVHLRLSGKYQQYLEKNLLWEEECLARAAKAGESTEKWQAALTKTRAMIAAFKQIAVVQWAK